MRYFKRNGVACYHFSDSSNKLVLGDSLQLLPELSAGIFDMISPKGEKMKELKSCPFCGGDNEHRDDCYIPMLSEYVRRNQFLDKDDEKKLEEAWNTRVEKTCEGCVHEDSPDPYPCCCCSRDDREDRFESKVVK